jgi:hypothetical protein
MLTGRLDGTIFANEIHLNKLTVSDQCLAVSSQVRAHREVP